MVTDPLTPLNEQLRSEALIDREIAAMRLVQSGPEGVRVLAETALDTQVTPPSRLTALRHLPARNEIVPVLARLLTDPLPALRDGALVKAEQAHARNLIPLVRALTHDPATYWDLDEEIAISTVARRVLAALAGE